MNKNRIEGVPAQGERAMNCAALVIKARWHKSTGCPVKERTRGNVRSHVDIRGHCFVRYADDCNVYVRSHRAGQRVMALLRRQYDRLRL